MFGIKDIYVTFWKNKRAASKSLLLLSKGEWRNTIMLPIVLTEH